MLATPTLVLDRQMHEPGSPSSYSFIMRAVGLNFLVLFMSTDEDVEPKRWAADVTLYQLSPCCAEDMHNGHNELAEEGEVGICDGCGRLYTIRGEASITWAVLRANSYNQQPLEKLERELEPWWATDPLTTLLNTQQLSLELDELLIDRLGAWMGGEEPFPEVASKPRPHTMTP